MTRPFENYPAMFQAATGKPAPYAYQTRLACGDIATPESGTECLSQLIDIPTGLGKTAAVILAWLWNRAYHPDATWPRRLVYCLPMRTLVEQTRDDAKKWLENLRLEKDIKIHLLMGGEERSEFDLHPESNAILIGTQDMLLSRALNRGYGISRFRWPMHFALLNNDALWVLDETQLMGVGVETSAQMEGFRAKLAFEGKCATWWMSATLAQAQLDTVDHPMPKDGWQRLALLPQEKTDKEIADRIDARKPVAQAELALTPATKGTYARKLAELIVKKHQEGTFTLVIVNRVIRAQEIYQELLKLKKDNAQDIALIHSRFRPCDRKGHEELLKKERTGNRIVVATQAVEAGVDISARLLLTELAPWSSLVQRIGRCNRYGEHPDAEIIWIDVTPKDDKDNLCLPYDLDDLAKARDEMAKLEAASPSQLAAIQVEAKPIIRPVLRRKDLLDLFDTTADLCGQDIDISRYIRDGDDTDVEVFWRDFSDEKLQDQLAPDRDEICRVNVGIFRAFQEKFKAPLYTWAWNHLDSRWERAPHIIPGGVYLLKSESGGYSKALGWDPKLKTPVEAVSPTDEAATQPEDTESDPLSKHEWQTIAEHTDLVCTELADILRHCPVTCEALPLAARWHDWGKGHPIFQAAIRDEIEDTPRPKLRDQREVAKAPGDRKQPKSNWWKKYERKFFRHELASALAILQPATPIPEEWRTLVAYLAATHHGKVRLSIRSLPGEKTPPGQKRFARGIWQDDRLPSIDLGGGIRSPEIILSLEPMELGLGEAPPFEGQPSWAERMLGLRDEYGPFRLAFYEALLRAADMRASARSISPSSP